MLSNVLLMQIPGWNPVTVVKGGPAANALCRGLDSEWGRKLVGKTLIRNIAQSIYQNRKQLEKGVRQVDNFPTNVCDAQASARKAFPRTCLQVKWRCEDTSMHDISSSSNFFHALCSLEPSERATVIMWRVSEANSLAIGVLSTGPYDEYCEPLICLCLTTIDFLHCRPQA